MTKIRRVETYLSPLEACRLVQLRRVALDRYVRLGILTNYRTEGGHRRYALTELRNLRDVLLRQKERIADR